ncbi:MAG: DNA modification methylase [Planctomycetes bacterium]|nr:DNA modification methylase [Planctomycetota bacterium]
MVKKPIKTSKTLAKTIKNVNTKVPQHSYTDTAPNASQDRRVSVQHVPPATLKEWDKNPRKNDKAVSKLAKIIETHGFINPIIATPDGTVRSGHTRLKVAKKMKMETVPVIYVPFNSEEDAEDFAVADNKSAEFSEWDSNLLADLFGSREKLDLDKFERKTGFTVRKLNRMLNQRAEHLRGLTDPDQVPGRVITTVNPGELWHLGEHRLLCGDSTKSEDIIKLMDGSKADSMITDPPYGVNYSSKNETLNKFDKSNRIQTPIKNDGLKDYKEFFENFIQNAFAILSDYNTCFIFMSGRRLHELYLAFESSGGYMSDYLVWVKNNHVLSSKDYNGKHEFLLYGWSGRHKFYGPSRTTVFEYDRSLKSKLHPTVKPVELIIQLIVDGSKSKSIIFDPFLGSGTTIIAAEQIDRYCYGIEIDPKYCNVIIKRWEDFTGKKAHLQKRFPKKLKKGLA